MRPEFPHPARAFAGILIAGALHAPVATATPSAFAVPVARRADLQAELDRHGSVQLDADADYDGPGVRPLVLDSGQRLFGGWNTHLPRILIPGGVHDLVIEGVRGAGRDAPDIIFGPGDPTQDVVIIGGNGGRAGGSERLKVEMQPGSRIERLALTEFGGLRVRHGDRGYIRGSVFTRLLTYWRGPVLSWVANAREPSGGNAILGTSLVTPQAGASIKDLRDLWMVGWDCESWNSEGRGSSDCFAVEGLGSLVSIGLSGGTADPASGAALLRLRHIRQLVTFFQRGRGGARDGADIVLDDVGNWLSLQDEGTSRVVDRRQPLDAVRLHQAMVAGRDGGSVIHPIPALPPAPVSPLARPARREIPDPPTPSPRPESDGDDAAWIQAQLDAHGVVRLAPGTYRLARPLRLGIPGRLEGLIGTGEGTVVLAASGDFPIIRGRAPSASERHPVADVRLVLSGLTLYGGSHGIRWSGAADDLGPLATVAWSTFRDLRFIGQRVAGVEADGITGIDSNLWFRVDFRDLPVAFRGKGSGAAAGMNYADKQLFLDCQFQHIADSAWYWTADRSSGGHVWQQDYFGDVGQLSRTRAANNLLWYDSVFEDVRGARGIEVVDRGATATYYFYVVDGLWIGAGPRIVTDSQSAGMGTLFINTDFAQRGGALVGSEHPVVSGWNSRVTGQMAVGPVEAGVFIDSRLGRFNRRLQVVNGGVPVTLGEGPAMQVPRRDR